MKSPYKKVIVYDLETGGFSSEHNSITEIAAVCIDLETLEAIDEMTVMILPYLNIKMEETPMKEAKQLYKMLSVKDEDSGKKVLNYKGQNLSLYDLEELADDIENFQTKIVSKTKGIIENEELSALLASSEYKDITKLFFDKSYSPGALEATHITKELLMKEGIQRGEAALQIEDFFKKHTEANNKPILSGHNIKKFDNPFFDAFLSLHSITLKALICETQMIDTLEWARLRWFDMPSYALGVVANELGVTLKGAHRALADTQANAQFLIKMLQSFRGEGTQKSTYTRKKYTMNF
jgi:DNA polymerase III alpha subunit (gram-positive type)